MAASDTNIVISPEIVRELRETAARGSSVRELVQIIQGRLGCEKDCVIPVLAGFVHAFCLPLVKVLPIREWLGSERDEGINALILPEIERARDRWMNSSLEPRDQIATDPVTNHHDTLAKQRS